VVRGWRGFSGRKSVAKVLRDDAGASQAEVTRMDQSAGGRGAAVKRDLLRE
jgi:hypothetical protein